MEPEVRPLGKDVLPECLFLDRGRDCYQDGGLVSHLYMQACMGNDQFLVTLSLTSPVDFFLGKTRGESGSSFFEPGEPACGRRWVLKRTCVFFVHF